MNKRAHEVNTIAQQSAQHEADARNEAFRVKLASWYGMYKQAEDEKAKKVKLTSSGALKRGLTSLGTTMGGLGLGGLLGYLAGDAIAPNDETRLAGTALGGILGSGTGFYAGDRIAAANKWVPEEILPTPGQLASAWLPGMAGGITGTVTLGAPGAMLGSVGGTLLGQYLHKKLTGYKAPVIEIVDDL